jgi:hypothetical protein
MRHFRFKTGECIFSQPFQLWPKTTSQGSPEAMKKKVARGRIHEERHAHPSESEHVCPDEEEVRPNVEEAD